MLWHCGEEEPKDCAGVAGGNIICGCTDSLATNFDNHLFKVLIKKL